MFVRDALQISTAVEEEEERKRKCDGIGVNQYFVFQNYWMPNVQ
jgi:hypothetical protein